MPRPGGEDQELALSWTELLAGLPDTTQALKGEARCGLVDLVTGAVCTKRVHSESDVHTDASTWRIVVQWKVLPSLLLPDDDES